MTVQQLSKTFKKGESPDHMLAVDKVYGFLEDRKKGNWIISINTPVRYPQEIIDQLPDNRTHKGHIFDVSINEPLFDPDGECLIGIKTIAFIEINGNVGYKYYDYTGGIRRANPTKHSKELQKRNDKINKNYCELKGIKYITLLKEEINGDIADEDRIKNTTEYLQRELLEFIK